MSKNRYINTSFWDDDFIQELSPDSKLLFIYLISNNLTNIAGIYPITKRRIMFDTGLTIKSIDKSLAVFQEQKKVYYIENKYIFLVNFIKHQKLNRNIQTAIVKIFNELPDFVKLFMKIDLTKPFKGLPEIVKALNYLNLNLNLNLNSNLEEKSAGAYTPKPKKTLKPEEVPDQVWKDYEIIRKNKKAPITETSMTKLINEAAKAKISVTEALETCIEKNWQGFKAEWYENQKPKQTGNTGSKPKTPEKYKSPYTMDVESFSQYFGEIYTAGKIEETGYPNDLIAYMLRYESRQQLKRGKDYIPQKVWEDEYYAILKKYKES